jgi:Ca2+-transporting ATPase
VKIITGDNTATTRSIAKNAGIKNADQSIEGEALMKMNKESLSKAVQENVLFTRMFPEAKLAAIQALKKDNEIVAMVGDGVNDGPALKPLISVSLWGVKELKWLKVLRPLSC